MESLGIPNYGLWYIEISESQNLLTETLDIHNFINRVIFDSRILDFQGEKKLQFINYGHTQLVFVLTVNTMRYTLLVNQPATSFGVGRKEFDNLSLFSINSTNVIKPLYYFCDNIKNELYVTPYVYQSRCIGVETNQWGIWIPEPDYHFLEFRGLEQSIVKSCMIAILIQIYNEEYKVGIVKCRLDGGDFMMEKGSEHFITYETMLNQMTLIAARETMCIDLEGYISLIRKELQQSFNGEHIFLSKKLKAPFTEEEIETGIKLGLELRRNKKLYK